MTQNLKNEAIKLAIQLRRELSLTPTGLGILLNGLMSHSDYKHAGQGWGLIGRRYDLGKGYELSVVGGDGNYSTPRNIRGMKTVEDFTALEIAMIGPDHEWVSGKRAVTVSPTLASMTMSDDVAGYVDMATIAKITGEARARLAERD